MPVQLTRFPEFELTLVVYSGAVTPEMLREHVRRLEPGDVVRCLHYCDATADMSGVDVAFYPEFRRIIGEKLRQAGETPRSALVSDSRTRELALRFWPSYVGRDDSYVTEPVPFDTLEAACGWFGLPQAGREAVVEAARSLAAAEAG